MRKSRALAEVIERFGVECGLGVFGPFRVHVRKLPIGAIGPQHVHYLVVEAQKGRLQTADDDVLVVARVGDDGCPTARAGKVLEAAGLLDLELHAVARIVEIGYPR